jgi:hypothetical protein
VPCGAALAGAAEALETALGAAGQAPSGAAGP